MKRFKLFLAISTISLLSSISGYSQSSNNPIEDAPTGKPIYVGPVLGYNRTFHSADLPTANPVALCPIFTNGDNNGFFAGASIEFLIGTKDSKSSIIGRVLYNTFPASFSQKSGEAEAGGLPIIGLDDKPELTDVMHTNEVNYSTITMEVMYKFNFMGGLGVVVGPSFDYALTRTQEQKMSLISPSNAYFKENPAETSIRYTDFVSGNTKPRGIIMKEGEIPTSTAFRAALKAGIQYEILTKSNMYIIPSLSYNLGLTSLTSEQTWRVSAIQIGVDVRFAIK